MYKVELNSCGNPDHYEDPYKQIEGAWASMQSCETIEQCQAVVRSYIEEHQLGGGNWAGGNVWTVKDEYVGHISYNGRFWDKDHQYGKLR